MVEQREFSELLKLISQGNKTEVSAWGLNNGSVQFCTVAEQKEALRSASRSEDDGRSEMWEEARIIEQQATREGRLLIPL
jgi:hypothetical protein